MPLIRYLLILLISSSAIAQPVSYENMTKQWINLTEYQYLNDAEFGNWFLQNYMKDTYSKVKDKAFELDIAISTAAISGKRWLNDINEDEYTLTAKYTFGAYDIKTESFPINADIYKDHFSATSDYYMEFLDLPDKAVLVLNIDAHLKNTRLSMTPTKAKAFVKSRKDKYGNIDRSLNAKLSLKVIGAGGRMYDADKALVLNSDLTSFELIDPKTKKLIKKFK